MTIFLICNALVAALMTLSGFLVVLDPSESSMSEQKRQQIAAGLMAVFGLLFVQSCSLLYQSLVAGGAK